MSKEKLTAMILLGHETEEAAQASAAQLRAMSGQARRLLAECIEASEIRRKKLSNAVHELEAAGFIFIRDIGSQWGEEFEIKPSLAGEEAMEIIWMSEEK